MESGIVRRHALLAGRGCVASVGEGMVLYGNGMVCRNGTIEWYGIRYSAQARAPGGVGVWRVWMMAWYSWFGIKYIGDYIRYGIKHSVFGFGGRVQDMGGGVLR